MSITKHEKTDELISQKDIDSEKFSTKSSRCSCLNCDSVGCFEKRHKAVKYCCQCGICRDLRKKSSTNNKDHREFKDLESATKKIIREVITRETIESLKRVTETMYEFGNDTNFGIFMDRKCKLQDKIDISTPTKSKSSIKIESSTKRTIGDSNSTKNCCTQIPIVKAPSTDLTDPHKENCTATKLSAQVMNVPYEDLHETVPSSQEITEQNPLSKLNIFRRIKEIYEACSCKVCECISSKPREIQNDFCECKPCQCADCVKLRLKIEQKIKRLPHSGCPCIRCDRRDCRGIAKNTSEQQACDCSPSDATQYPDNLAKRCNCEPCQCINCRLLNQRTPKTVKLGQVDAYIQRETCQCSPCECIECKQIYSRTNPTIMCTHVSDANRYGNFCRCHDCTERCQFGMTEICKCDTHNIPLRKLYHKNYNDYDIRTVIVDNNGPFKQQNECDFGNNKTVTLFASLKNNYPSNSCSKGICKCGECECIVCSAKDDSLRNYRDRLKDNVMSLHDDIKLSTSFGNACKCTPCECEICSKRAEHDDSMPLEKKCRCDICDCLNCDNVSLATSPFPSSSTARPSYSFHRRQLAKPIRSTHMNKNCNCNPCDCRNCKKLFSCSSSIKFYSDGKSVEKKTRHSRKVMLVTPSTSESHLKSRKRYVQNVSSTTLSAKQSVEGIFRQDLSTCHAVSKNYTPLNNLSHTNKSEVCQLYQSNKAYNLISDDDVEGETFFKLNNPVLDTASFKSVEETPILNYLCNFPQSPNKTNKMDQKQDISSEEKYKHFFNITQEQPDRITPNESNESLPVYWACCNATSYPRTNPRSIKITCKKVKSGLKDDKSNRLNKTHCSKTKQDDLNENPREKIRNPVLEDMNKSKKEDTNKESVNDSYGSHYNYNCDNESLNFPRLSEINTDYFNTSPKEYRKTTVNHSDISIDYERASRVLHEAKAFSSKLIKMLDSFEIANKKFESASQKFKVLHESLLNINESEVNKSYSANLRRMPRPIFETAFGVISEVHQDSKELTDVSVKDENQAEREYEKSNVKPDDLCNNSKCTEELSINDTVETQNITIIVDKANDAKTQERSEVDNLYNCNMIQSFNSQSQFEKRDSMQIFNVVKSLQDVSDPTNLDTSVIGLDDDLRNKMENKNADIIVQKPTMASVINKLDSVLGNITITNTSVATDDVEENLVELSKQQNNRIWQIFKKNLYLNPCPKDKRTIFQSSALELDIKEAIQAISLQSRSENYSKVVPRPNEALANLQSEVNDLLNMPMLQMTSKFKCKAEPEKRIFPRSKLDLEVKSLSSTASSQTYDQALSKADKEVYFNINSEVHPQKSKLCCDQLKANFIGLRRVSDHTVLVKWSVPERIADVQGYELLVDGRAVQKIFSATRSMAVVTCLPPAARVLLTVRTLAAPGCGRAPASTIVYRPRMKQ